MSLENVEIIKAGIDAYNRGDWEAALGHMASDFELDFSRAIGPLRGVYRLDQMGRFQEDMGSVWESIWLEAHEFIEVQDQVVVPWTMHVKGRDEIELTARVALTFTFRDGAIVGAVMYQEREEALEAVGLSEQAMSPQNVEVVRRGWEAFMRGDDGFWEQFDAEVEWTTAEDEPDPQTYRGVEGVRRLVSMLFDELWERDFEVLSIEFIDAGRFVVVPVRVRVKARQSGVELEAEEVYVQELRGGKVVRVREYRTKREALETLGLSE